MKRQPLSTILISLFFLLILSTGIHAQSQSPAPTDSCHFSVSPIVRPVDTDKLMIGYSCNIQSFKFEIFNRWGTLVYSTTALSKQLDLNIYEKVKEGGKDVPKYSNGTYFWWASYEVLRGGKLFPEAASGVVTIYAGR